MLERKLVRVLSLSLDAITWEAAIARIAYWSARRESRYVCICNAHSCVTAGQDGEFAKVIEGADMATPDGAPTAWMLRKLGYTEQQRINGPDLMWKYCAHSVSTGEAMFLYGASPDTLQLLQVRLREEFPGINIAGAYSPPFRALDEAESEQVVAMINNSGASIVWVSLGCPKQEKWMALQRDRVRAVMIGVGAGFDYHAQTIRRAPLWMQHNGLEWLYRLGSEPRRLWRRYLVTNTLFILGATKQLLFRNISR